MATSKSFFGKRRGSTKNFTFAVFNGKQVTKEKAEQVKNPRTLAQMRNRMILTTSSAAYAAMKEIVDHSFQGFVYGLQNMSRFQSVNNKLLRDNLQAVTSQFAYDNYGESRFLPGLYVVSEGSASPVVANYLPVMTTSAGNITINIRTVEDSEESFTASNFFEAIGIGVGEIATVLVIVKKPSSEDFLFAWVRIIAKAAGAVKLTSANYSQFFEVESNMPFTVSLNDSDGAINIPVTGLTGADFFCKAYIHSALRNGIWTRSDSQFEPIGNPTFEPTAEDALATYPVGNDYILNGGEK